MRMRPEKRKIMVEELNEASFMPKVMAANGKVMVEFFATWCPHCQRMAPIVDELAEAEKGNAEVYRVDVDKNPELANTYAPNGFPTFCVFDKGEFVKGATGEQTLEYLENMLDI